MTQDGGGGRFSGRVEDERLLRGRGRFADDVRHSAQAFAAFVRSPHAHARIASLDVDAARAAPGVVGVLTWADMAAAGVGNVSVPPPLAGRGGQKLVVPHRPPLARERTVHVGQPVALVVAETAAAAEDAAALVDADYRVLPAVVGAEAALRPDAPQVWPEAPGNLAIDWPGPVPDEESDAEVARILAEAPRVVRLKAVNQRLAGAPLEPRGATAAYDPDSGRHTFFGPSQGPAILRGQLAAILGVEPRLVRVVTEDVGGAFGLKTPAYPEYAALLVAARLLGRPVHWMADRSEAFVSDHQGRGNATEAELALDADGRFLALRVSAVTDLGAFISSAGAQIATMNFARCFPTVYRIPRVAVRVRLAFTNTVPTGPYRGAGRPEANYVMERLVEMAARETGIDPIALRRRNLIPEREMPFATPVGTVYDSGAFEAVLDAALAAGRYESFAERRAASRARGRLRGLGVSCFLEHAGGRGAETADLAFRDGRLVLGLAAQSTGQGHATVFAEALGARLGLPAEAVRVVEGDSDLGLAGGPSVGSRTAMAVGAALAAAADALLDKGRRAAALHFEAAEEDVRYAAGSFEVAGTDRRIGLFDLAAEAAAMAARGEIAEALDTRSVLEVPASFPNGCHVAEVEIDPETGRVEVVAYAAVDDCGTVLDGTLAEGQIVGGLAQGLGQALLEEVVYDPGTGQLVTGTFNDYAMPRADLMPPVASLFHPVPCRTNPLGVKGVGEAGTTAAIAAVMNAIADAIPDGRGAGLDMPATPEKVWRACSPG